MKWYEDAERLSYFAIYKREDDLKEDIEASSKEGWIVEETTDTQGHVNIGRLILTAGMWGSRSSGKMTVKYSRDERWSLPRSIERLLPETKEKREDYNKAKVELAEAEKDHSERFARATAVDIVQTDLEKDLLNSLKRVVDRRARVVKARAEFSTNLAPVKPLVDKAIEVGAALPSLQFAIDDELMRAVAEEREHDAVVEKREQVLIPVQEDLVDASKKLEDARERQAKANKRLADAGRDLDEAGKASASAVGEQKAKAEKKVKDASEELAKRQREASTAESAEQTARQKLNDSVSQRKTLVSDAEISDASPASPVSEVMDAAVPPASAPPLVARAEFTPKEDAVGLLERLGELHAAGVLTDEEFAAKKQQVLERI